MRGLVVIPSSGWILSKIGQRIAEAAGGYDCVSYEEFSLLWEKGPDYFTERYDFMFYVDVQNCWLFTENFKDMLKPIKHIGFFTHIHEDNPKHFRVHWANLDGIVHMNNRYFNIFQDQGFYPADKMTVIYPGEIDKDIFKVKPIVVGVCQRGGFEGKGYGFLEKVFNQLPEGCEEYLQLKILGSGWDKDSFKFKNVEISDNEDYANYPDWYQSIDYLLVPSRWEGGCMSVLEAFATGIPIITSDVGWMKDFEEFIQYIYQPGNHVLLGKYLYDLAEERKGRREFVLENFKYKDYVQELEFFVEELDNE
jgi:glycosyltransferase involved in cell wall biosynthesis